ncbi:MAG: hypothetical protein WBB85_21750 [Albidovulum sp.]|uniref:hypothetical protein n=1 Tax=Albidovulum sp. TaxID=1872424 RepID=UPI003CC1BACA
MNAPVRNRGGAPVGFVSELDSVEAAAVLYLRLWSDGPNAKERVADDFVARLGADAGRHALHNFEDLCRLCIHYGRRPLMRHHVTCKCLGADEACFANFVATAGEGLREDAVMIATVLVRPDVALPLTDLERVAVFEIQDSPDA